jgi:hypothetical protein
MSSWPVTPAALKPMSTFRLTPLTNDAGLPSQARHGRPPQRHQPTAGLLDAPVDHLVAQRLAESGRSGVSIGDGHTRVTRTRVPRLRPRGIAS